MNQASSEFAASPQRMTTGIPSLDEALGGGLLPGTLTVIVGATGIGKTQFGMHFVQAGVETDGQAGAIVDLCSRGDSQSHREYLGRMFEAALVEESASKLADTSMVAPGLIDHVDRLSVFPRIGLRTGRKQLEDREWTEWKSHVNRNLEALVGFLYHRFVNGCRRVVVDGFEPADDPAESIQFELFEYMYHQILRKEYDWLARDLYRQRFRTMQESVVQAAYDHQQIACLALCTSHHSLLDQLISDPLQDGDILANANTLVYLGKIMDGREMRRGLYIAKHRGSACSDSIMTYSIDDRGITLD